jgi:predicted permease
MAWYRRLFRADDFERERAFHLAERADDLRAAGLTAREADAEARRRFGNPRPPRDLATWLDSATADLRTALRALRRSPVFTLVAVGSLALGVGANVAIFSLVDAVSLRALPVPHPEQLLQVGVAHAGEGGFVGVEPDDQRFSNPLWEQLRDRPNGFAAVAAYGNLRANLADAGEARYAVGAFVSGGYFRLFDVAPAVGRLLTARDDVRGCPPVVVLGEAFWSREYGRDPNVVGRTLSLDGKPFRIVGVAGGRFTGPEVGRVPPFLVPLCAEPALRGDQSRLDARSDWWLSVIARRPAGADPRQIGARLTAIAPEAYAATLPPGNGAAHRERYLSHTFSLGALPRGLSSLHDRFHGALLTLMAFVAVVLLIACANVANLLLARGAARRRELAVRTALGAGRGRLVRQLLTESALLATLGAVGGLFIARWGASALVGMISMPGGRVELDLPLDLRLLGATALVTALTVALFGVLPARRATRVAPEAAMRAAGRAVVEGHSRLTLGKALVGAQVALSLVLLVAAGLLVTSLRRLATDDPGFRQEGVLLVTTDLRRGGVPKEQLGAVRAALLETLRAVPGVADASESHVTPVSGDRWNDVIVVDGYTPRDPDDAQILFNRVSPRYFATLGSRLLAGRDFGAADAPTAPRAAIVNEAFARRFFRDPRPLGRQFHTRVGDTLSAPLTVVGVVENAKYQSLREEPGPIAYVAMTQGTPGPTMNAELRTVGDPASYAPAVRAAVARVQPRLVVELTTLSSQAAASISRERLLAVLSAAFGAVALALATLGLYGVMAYSVARRTTEIGVRQALGADRGRVVRMVLADVGRVVLAGALVGAVAAAPVGRLMASLLFRTRPVEPLVLGGAAGVLALVALLAGLLPARRASRVAPMTALREE